MKTKRYSWLVFIIVCLALAAFAVPASVGALRSEAIVVLQTEAITKLTSLTGHEVDPDTAYAPPNDQFLLAFSYSEPSGEIFLYSIQAQLVDASGSPVSTPLVLSSNDVSPRQHPAVAYNSGAGEFLVIWDDEYGTQDHDIYARRVNGSGSLIGSEYVIDYSNSDDSLPDLVYNPATGEYLAVYERYDNDSAQSEIYAQRLDANGAPTGAGFYIASDSIDKSGVSVSCDAATGEYLVVWHQQTAAENYDIYGQRVTSGGALTGGMVPISTASGDQLHPQLAYNSAHDEFLVVWGDGRTDGDIYGQRLSGTGGLIGGNFAIAEVGTNYRSLPHVAYQPDAVDFMVTWQMSAPGEDVNLYRRRVRTDGSLPEGEIAVSALGSFEQSPTIAAGGELSYLVAWQDSRDMQEYENIYGMIVRLNRIQGKVFQGLEGDETTPLEGVVVSMYGSNNAGEQGTLLESMPTFADGWFGMIAPAGYEYYSMIETNPVGYFSEAAFSPDGSVLSSDWIQYAIPLEDKELAGNRFWDQPEAFQGCGGVFYPTADSSIYIDDPYTPYGNEPFLDVWRGEAPTTGQAHSFLTFDLEGRIPEEAIIHSAELELTLNRTPSPAEFQLQVVSIPVEWDKSTLTWNTPPVQGYAFETKSYNPIWSEIDPVVLRVDVSTLVNLWATGVFTPTSIALLPGGERVGLRFYSREASANQPRLVVHCSPVVEPLPQSDVGMNTRQLAGLERLTLQSSITPTIQLGESGAVRFALFDITPPEDLPNSLSRALWFTQVYSDALRLSDPQQDLQFVRRSEEDSDLFFRQRYAGIPVLGSEINIHLLHGHITGLSGSYLSDLHLSPSPQIPAERARQIALALGMSGASIISEDQLRLLNRSLFYGENVRTFLTWMVVLDQGGGEELYIDASTGALRFQQPRSLAGFDLDLQTASHNSGTTSYCHHWWWTTDDDFWCDEDGCNSDADQEGLDAYQYAKQVYNYWQTYLGRDSYDDDGSEISMYIHVGNNWQNANYMGGCDFMQFGDGFADLDIIGHEFSHGVTNHTSDLTKWNEPGALEESFSDINGAFVDGDWEIGEDAPGSDDRSLEDPTIYGDPDRYNHPWKVAAGTSDDYGGVHTNNGINNKAAYLVTEGGSFNGVDIPWGGIGLWRARVLFYKTLKRLTSNASMLDTRNAALASAKEMAQQNTNGFTTSMICIVRNSYHAVELGDGDLDCDGVEDNVDSDQDGDKVPNTQDNCSTTSNSDQKNTDKNSQGDACDTDDDNDGDLDTADNCPLVSNSNQVDTNGDGEGDACDDNDDNDLISDAQDNCPLVTNHDQLDTDGDGDGDACDDDDDDDGWSDIYDNCSLVQNSNQANSDSDPFGDACDLCPNYYGTDNGDPDQDGKGNSCDDDDDNDGVLDEVDNCPVNYNPEQHDIDGDGNGWACDQDDADILLQMLKMLTLKYNRDSPIRFPLPGCGVCGPGYINPLYKQKISLVSQAGFYAQIIDSTGKIVDRTSPANGNLLNQSLSFKPVPFASHAMLGQQSWSVTRAVLLASDDVRYYLELFPAEDVDVGQVYTMTIQVEEYIDYDIYYLPVIMR